MIFEMSLIDIRINKATLNAFLNTSAGPLWGELDRRAELVRKAAIGKVGVDTGNLKRSIYKRHLGNSTGQYIIIGSDKKYASDHHQGTRPHQIVASGGGKLTFVVKGKRIYTNRVNHPGTKPNPYLTTFLPIFIKPRIIIN
jgi:phage gpG-like protein